MKKTLTLSFIFLVITLNAQTKTKATATATTTTVVTASTSATNAAAATTTAPTLGWYHLLSGAKTKVLFGPKNLNAEIGYSKDEVLFVFEIKEKSCFAIDFDGWYVQIENIEKIKRIDVPGKLVKMIEDVDVDLDRKLHKGNNCWLVGYDSAKGTGKILFGSGDVIEVPKSTFKEIMIHLAEDARNIQYTEVK